MRYGSGHLFFGHKLRVTRRHQTRRRDQLGNPPPLSAQDRRRLTWIVVGFIILVIVANLLKFAGWPGPSDQDKWCAAHQEEINRYVMEFWGTTDEACSILYQQKDMGR
jgi:hypothetical protein